MLVKFDSRVRKDVQSSQGQKFRLRFTAEGGMNNIQFINKEIYIQKVLKKHCQCWRYWVCRLNEKRP